MAKSVALWRFIPPACRACRAWVWLRSSSAIIHVYVPWFVGWDDETPSFWKDPPNGEVGKIIDSKVPVDLGDDKLPRYTTGLW